MSLTAADQRFKTMLHLIRCPDCRAFSRTVKRQRSDIQEVMDVAPSADLRERTLGGFVEDRDRDTEN